MLITIGLYYSLKSESVMPLTLFIFPKIALAFVDFLWFSKNGKNGGSVIRALMQFGVSGVGVYKVSTTLSGPFYDVWRDRFHCWVLQVKDVHGLSRFS